MRRETRGAEARSADRDATTGAEARSADRDATRGAGGGARSADRDATRVLAYIPRRALPAWLGLGWCVVGELAGPHRRWSVMGEWLCDCEVRWPRRPQL